VAKKRRWTKSSEDEKDRRGEERCAATRGKTAAENKPLFPPRCSAVHQGEPSNSLKKRGRLPIWLVEGRERKGSACQRTLLERAGPRRKEV